MSPAARIGWMVLIVYWAGLFIVSHIPIDRLPIPVKDKTAHFIAYGLLAAGLYGCLRSSYPRRGLALLVLAFMLVYGAIDELLQIPVGRSCELADWFADAAGAVAALSLAVIINRWLR